MKLLTKKKNAFRPSLSNASLEERVVLSGGPGSVPVFLPPVTLPPYSPIVHLSSAQLRTAYTGQLKAASADLKAAVNTDISQLYASGTPPTAQQLTDFSASVQGAIDATAVRVSSQLALLPGSSARLVPTIQNSLLGSTATSLTSRLAALLQTGSQTASAQDLLAGFNRGVNATMQTSTSQVNHFLNTTALNRMAVNSSGQRISLPQYMGGQIVSQLANTLGNLAQSIPTVANAALTSADLSQTTTQQLFAQLGVQARTALSTAAFQLGSDLALFPGGSSVGARIAPMVFGTNTITPVSTTGSTNAVTSLASALQGLSFGDSGLGSAVSSVFSTGLQSLATPIDSFLGVNSSTVSLPTTGFTSLFNSQLSNFASGFNNGFATGTTGFIGLGQAPTTFNSNFGTGFDNLVSTVNQSGPLGTIGNVGGVPVESR